MESILCWAIYWSGTCWCISYWLSWKKITRWCLMVSLEKGTKTPKTDTELVNKSASGTISTQGWRPWVRETCCAAWKCQNWLCQEIVLPGSNYCFLITAFSLQLFLASLLCLGLPWWLIKFQSRWLCRAAGDSHLPGKAGFALAKLQGHCQLFVLAVGW